MNVRRPMGVLHSFSIKNIFYDKIDLRLFYFPVTILMIIECWNLIMDERILAHNLWTKIFLNI